MMYSLVNGRNTRNKNQMYSPMHNPFANYCTESLQSDMKMDYENEIFLNNLHLIPDPLMKNLADTLITSEKPEKVQKQSLDIPIMLPKQPSKEEVRADSTLAGITNFFSGVFSMLSGAVFRTRSQVDYYDCFDAEARQGSPPTWPSANDVQDKNGQAPDRLSSVEPSPNGVKSEMNNCKTVSSCEEKINQVRYLLSPASNKSNPIWLRKRPKKVFVEPGSVEDSFEDAFAPEDFVPISNDNFIEYYSPLQYHNEEFCETEAPTMRIEVAPVSANNIVKVIDSEGNNTQMDPCDLPEKDTIKLGSDKSNSKITEDNSGDDKHELVSSCEDKLSKLKALLKEKRTAHTEVMDPSPELTAEQPRPAKTIPIIKPVDKHYKNPHRMLDKRRKMKMKRSIQDDVNFANEIDPESPADSPSTPSTITSSETSLGDYFDETKGRFRTASTTESEDSFQIVFNDSPKRSHKASDCESEDSFIVFEDDNCYTSNDVFGDSDSDSDVSDSGCSTMTCKLSHSLSRTVSNLTDDTLYESSDEVDCARVEPKVEARGLLMDADRKNLKKDQPAKKVTFSTDPPTVRVMRVWAFAARQARAGHWERYALDRDRFKRRIADVDMAVSWVLKPQHRARVMFQRFMPLWNRQKRQEIAEKKERQAEEKRVEEERKEEERKEEERQEEERKLKLEENRENSEFDNDTINKALENLRIYNIKRNQKRNERNERYNNKVNNVRCFETLNTKKATENRDKLENESSELVELVSVSAESDT